MYNSIYHKIHCNICSQFIINHYHILDQSKWRHAYCVLIVYSITVSCLYVGLITVIRCIGYILLQWMNKDDNTLLSSLTGFHFSMQIILCKTIIFLIFRMGLVQLILDKRDFTTVDHPAASIFYFFGNTVIYIFKLFSRNLFSIGFH